MPLLNTELEVWEAFAASLSSPCFEEHSRRLTGVLVIVVVLVLVVGGATILAEG